MKLYMSPASPFARKARIIVRELDLVRLVEEIPTNPATSEELRKTNPLGKIPALVLDDGSTLIDSPVICEYLNELGGGKFFPGMTIWREVSGRWRALTLQALGDGIADAAVAHQLSTGFVPVRKKGKLPFDVIGEEYDLEYGKDRVEIHTDAVKKGEYVVLVDDLIATGGTAFAAIKLLERAGAKVIGCVFVIDLPELGGADKIRALGKEVTTLVSFEGH